mmetsp:Transcript_35614/g.98646  ORF Transcript_35614/g.98646 Transcript_35614/m.98646 type:complete len:226 (+) Transcript_35614:1601-2278(+)
MVRHGGQLLRILVVQGPQALQLPSVLIGMIPHLLAQVLHAFLQRGVLHVAVLHGVEVPGVLVVGRLQVLHVLGVPLRGVADGLLRVLEAVRQGGVLLGRRVQRLELLAVPVVGRLVPGVRSLDILQLPCMLLERVVHQVLKVVHALLQCGVVPCSKLERLCLPGRIRRVLGMRGLERLNLCEVLVGRFTNGLLQILDTLLQAGVLRARGPQARQVLGMAAVRLLE